MLREIKEDFLWCYRDDRRRMGRELVRAVLWIGCMAAMLFVLETWWG